MNEAEWSACEDPRSLLDVGQAEEGGRRPSKKSARKLRLFAAACFRRAWASLLTEPSRRVVEGLERCADGAMTLKKLAVIDPTTPFASLREVADPWQAAYLAIFEAARGAVVAAPRLQGGVYVAELAAQATLLRDILPLVFRPDPLAPECVTPTVVWLARVTYQERDLPSGLLDPARLAVLSDALEEAGCTDAALLDHLRSPGPHVRGCWALDLILGKQ